MLPFGNDYYFYIFSLHFYCCQSHHLVVPSGHIQRNSKKTDYLADKTHRDLLLEIRPPHPRRRHTNDISESDSTNSSENSVHWAL